MPSNQVSSVDVPLSIFGSWNTELSPPDIPEGGSPANNDVVYTPGSVATRPGLNRVFTLPISALGPISYEKSFVTATGAIKNLYFTKNDGILWVEDVTNSPGTVTQLFASAGATYASSVTAFNREYIALSDGQFGVDIPLQYDGTNLWRVTADGPAAPPVVTSLALPAVAMLATSGGVAQTIVSITSSNPVTRWEGPDIGYVTFYTSFTVTLAGGSTAPMVDTQVTIAGNSNAAFNGVFFVQSVTGLVFTCGTYSDTLLTGTGGTATPGGAITLQRQNNTVTGATATAHRLAPGYQVQIQGAGTTVVGGTISSIVLNNEDTPGLATVTTSAAHGLLPNNQVNISGVTGATVGTAITNVAFAGNFVTITTSTAHGLSVGSQVIVTAGTNTTVNGQWTVAEVPSTTTFTYAFVSIVTAYSAADTGTVKYLWPLASTNPALNYFTVQTAPTDKTFTIALYYTDGTWTGGTVSFGWDGIFFVTAAPSATTFQYQQYGPNATTATVGTVTPYGQMTPGIHQVRVSWIYASGAISAPSPSATFVANGGQYPSLTSIPVGPSSYVVGRLLQFTGAGGAYFFDIPVPAQVNGLVVSTATQINDNTTTSLVLDFSDNTLYAAQADSIPGNNLAAQVKLGPCAGFFTYAQRLMGWGEANKVNNFLNMGFGGGTIAANQPLGWDVLGTGGTLEVSRLGMAWKITGDGSSPRGEVSQGASLDSYGAPIILPNTQYTVRAWAQGTVTNPAFELIFSLTASSPHFYSANVIITSVSSAGGYVQATFSTLTPNAVGNDMAFSFMAQNLNNGDFVEVTEIELIYTQQPHLNNASRISYANNAEGFDAITGIIGPQDDLSPIRNFGTIRQSLYIVTGAGLHQTQDNEQTEPSNWTVDRVADNCGAFSIASVGRNPQGIGSGGKDWLIWNGPDGAQIFTGQKPMKISQEIQSVWDAIPPASTYQCWVKNYESSKRCYFGIPSGSTMQVLVLDYRNIDGDAIAENPPIHISFTGKMIVSDLTRKWTSWTIPAWCGELMYRDTISQPQIVFGCQTPAGAANAYILNANQFHDDDFGVIPASYTTYFFVSHEMEQALQVGSHRHLYTLAAAYISGVGTWSITPLAASLSNAFPTSAAYPLATDPAFDMDFGINVETTRCAFRIAAAPVSGNNAYFKLQKLVINMAPAPWAKVRGSGTGAF